MSSIFSMEAFSIALSRIYSEQEWSEIKSNTSYTEFTGTIRMLKYASFLSW